MNRVEENIGIVVDMLNKKYKHFQSEREDLFQEGCEALVIANKKYDEKYGVRFSTYAYNVVRNKMDRYLRDKVYKFKAENISTDEELKFKNDKTVKIIDLLSTVYDIEDNITYQETRDKLMKNVYNNLQKKRDRKIKEIETILDLRIQGYNQSEIGRIMGSSQRYVWLRLEDCKKEIGGNQDVNDKRNVR